MANPAELLLDQLRAWHESSNVNVDIEERRAAARHFEATAELLDQMASARMKTKIFEKYVDHWAMMAYRDDWRDGDDDEVALDQLEHLADRLNDLVPKLQDGGLDEIRAYCQAAAELLDDDDSIDKMLRLHAKQVIAHLSSCIDNYDAVGDFDLQQAIERLIAAMMYTATTSKAPERWKKWLNTVVWPFGVNVASAIPAQALIQLTLGG